VDAPVGDHSRSHKLIIDWLIDSTVDAGWAVLYCPEQKIVELLEQKLSQADFQ